MSKKPIRSAQAAAQRLCHAAVPDWSEQTRGALAGLSARERSFVEIYATGCSAAEAYRRAYGAQYTGRETDWTRNAAYAVRSRPRVAKAIDLCMRDMNFGARMDR